MKEVVGYGGWALVFFLQGLVTLCKVTKFKPGEGKIQGDIKPFPNG